MREGADPENAEAGPDPVVVVPVAVASQGLGAALEPAAANEALPVDGNEEWRFDGGHGDEDDDDVGWWLVLL